MRSFSAENSSPFPKYPKNFAAVISEMDYLGCHHVCVPVSAYVGDVVFSSCIISIVNISNICFSMCAG